MEEVDTHILYNCRLLQCSFSEENDVKFSDLTTENCIEFFIRALWRINEKSQNDIPSTVLPINITARFKVASIIEQKLRDCNIRNDVGYQTLLYGSLNDLRRIFLSLIERLPKEVVLEEDHSTPITRLISSAALIERPLWVPEFCRRLALTHDGRFWCPAENDSDIFSFIRTRGDLWSKEPSEARDWLATLITANEQKGPQKTFKPKPLIAPKPRKLTEELNIQSTSVDPALKEKRSKLAEILSNLNEKRNLIIEEHYKSEGVKSRLDAKRSAAVLATNEKLLALLSNPVEGRERISKFLHASEEKAAALAADFELTRAEKMKMLEELKADNIEARKVFERKEYLRKCKARNAELKYEMEQNQLILPRLESRLSRIEDDVDREVVTRRIIEMTHSYSMMQKAIYKVIAENHSLEKEMKWLSQSLHRSFHIIGEFLASNAGAGRGKIALERFSSTRVLCEKALALLESNGRTTRNIQLLTDQVETEMIGGFEEKEGRILKDLEAVKQDNKNMQRLIC